MEWEVERDRHFYLGKGDLSIHVSDPRQKVHFPLAHYHGIAVCIFIEEVSTILPMLERFGVNLPVVLEKFCGKNSFYVERADHTIQHIFSELYTIPAVIQETYIKIKILELLLFLSAMECSDYGNRELYIPKKEIEKIESIRSYMIGHMDQPITLRELAQRFSISETTLKSYFKDIYGMPIYTYLRTYRLQKAAWLLRNTQDPITGIALSVGYSNASKFSSAFKSQIGVSPKAYRKHLD